MRHSKESLSRWYLRYFKAAETAESVFSSVGIVGSSGFLDLL